MTDTEHTSLEQNACLVAAQLMTGTLDETNTRCYRWNPVTMDFDDVSPEGGAR